jgi:hypothetical protein
MERAYFILKILIFLIFFNTNSFGQTYLPTIVKGKTWEITKPAGLGNYIKYSARLACDTVINSLSYTEVFSSYTNSFFVREDTVRHKIYKYNSTLGTDLLIIDYDITVGSTFNNAIVDSINYATYFGRLRKVIHFNNLVKWIEGIGSNFDGLLTINNGFTYVTNVYISSTTCFPLSTSEIGSNHLEAKQIGSNVYFSNSSEIPVSLRIFNTMGQLLNQFIVKDTLILDLHSYSAQVILLEMTSENKRNVMRVLAY